MAYIFLRFECRKYFLKKLFSLFCEMMVDSIFFYLIFILIYFFHFVINECLHVKTRTGPCPTGQLAYNNLAGRSSGDQDEQPSFLKMETKGYNFYISIHTPLNKLLKKIKIKVIFVRKFKN